MADNIKGTGRALAQGLSMGWSDEAEAWLRSKLGGESYEQLHQDINQEYGDFSEQNPFIAPGLEFVGGVAPAVATYLIPGAQVAAGATTGRALTALGRLARSQTARSAATGTVTGGIAAAGAAKPGERLQEVMPGAFMGATIGAAMPLAIGGGSRASRWLAERLNPRQTSVDESAAEKMVAALNQSGTSPKVIGDTVSTARMMGVPAVVANANPALSDLAEAVAQRGGAGSQKIDDALVGQKVGGRERAYSQVSKALKPGSYYDDEQRMVQELRSNAKTVYDKAYAAGDVNDPRIMEALKNPQFKKFYDKARDIADTEALAAKLKGEDPSKYALKPLFLTNADGVTEVVGLPDVRTLDYIKKGIDATIDSGFRSDKSISKAEASALRDLRRVFVSAIDENVPDYVAARQVYAGDIEVIDAMRSGLNDFNRLDHEQVGKMVGAMTPAEKEAFKTGVARHLYSKVMDPSGNFNAAQRIIGSPETQLKLQPLFDKPEDFTLFKAAMTKESQLFQQANKILGGSQTSRRRELNKSLEGDTAVGGAMADTVTGGFWGGLTGLVTRALRSGSLTEKTSAKLADMLMSNDPADVAAVVSALEKFSSGAAAKEAKRQTINLGTTSGVTATIQPSPNGSGDSGPIESELDDYTTEGPDIEADIEADIARELSKKK